MLKSLNLKTWKVSFILVMTFYLTSSLWAQGVVVIAGGGSEQGAEDILDGSGNLIGVQITDTNSWSYKAYSELVKNGDKDGDGTVEIAVLSVAEETDFVPLYFEAIGAQLGIPTVGINVKNAGLESTRRESENETARANARAKADLVRNADSIFIKGGDQGKYYDFWNGIPGDTVFEDAIREVIARNGGIGGTSAGAMSQADFAFTPRSDSISLDFMENADSDYLYDVDCEGCSPDLNEPGIHDDFLSFVPNTIIDTHFTERGRLGRLLAIMAMAKASPLLSQLNNLSILGIGLEQRTALIIKNGLADVVGVGAVTFVKTNNNTDVVRNGGSGLVFTHLTVDRLTEGWRYDLNQKMVNSAPADATTVSSVTLNDTPNSGALTIDGSTEGDKESYEHVALYPQYQLVSGNNSPQIKDSLGFSQSSLKSADRDKKHEILFRALYDHPEYLGVFAYSGGTISRTSNDPDVISFSGSSTILIDASTITAKSLSPNESNYSEGTGLHASALVNMTVHVVANSAQTGLYYNTRTHTFESLTPPSSSDYTEVELNDSRSTANYIENETFPLTIHGDIEVSNDKDYFEFTLLSGERLDASLDVPSIGDYDLYLQSVNGRTKARSTNDGYGVYESLSYTNTSNRKKTFYLLIESYSGSGSEDYQLDVDRY